MAGVVAQAAKSRRGSAPSLATASSASAFLKAENWPPPKRASTSALVSSSSAAKMPTRLSASGRPASPSTSPGSASGVGLGLADFLRDRVGIVGQRDQRIFRRVRLRHFLRAVAQAHHPRRRPLDQRLGQREERVAMAVGGDLGREIVVELLRDVAGELEMLLLVVADRHVGGAIDAECRRPSARDNCRARPRRSRGPCRPSP